MMDKDYRPALNTGVSTNVIAASTNQPQLAWEVIRFLSTSEKGQTLIGQGVYETPVLASVANSDAIPKPSWAAPGYDTRIKTAKLPGQMFTPYPLNLNLWECPISRARSARSSTTAANHLGPHPCPSERSKQP